MVWKQQSGTKRTHTPISDPMEQGLKEKPPPLEIDAEENSILGNQIFVKIEGGGNI